MSDYFTTIGLEIHAELDTASKMWCGCKNEPLAAPNINICEVCMAHPGTLPVANYEAIKKVIQVGLAVGGNIADFTEFDRKNYFYPDIPKAYQLSQYKYPIVSGGSIHGFALTRIHLEEDTAKSTHDKGGVTLVDYNRAGVPLMELVTEPVLHTAKDASEFAKELQRILRYVGASEANMEMGQMRVEANISVAPISQNDAEQTQKVAEEIQNGMEPIPRNSASSPRKSATLGTKVEVKNLNSFRSVEEAIAYEVERHIGLLESGEKVIQETRGWDEVKQETFSQRKKENAHDYRYFPDPDLPKFYLSELFDIESIRKELPELPQAKYTRFSEMYSLNPDTINILIDSTTLVTYFDGIVAGKGKEFAKLASNYIVADLLGTLKKEGKEIDAKNLPSTESFKILIEMVEKGELSSRGAKDLLPLMLNEPHLDVKKTAEERGMLQKSDPEALKKIVEEVLTESPTQVADYKAGKEAMFMYFVGQCMKKSKGSGNPGMFQELLKEMLK